MYQAIYFEELPSTNTWIKEHLNELDDRTAVIAGMQTAGKGRLGRTWTSQAGEALTFSVLFRQVEQTDLLRLPVIAAVSVMKALAPGTQIKWPNDIILDGKKICGILCESVTSGTDLHAIIGIGINLTQSEDFFSELPHASSIQLLRGDIPNQEHLLSGILARLDGFLACPFEDVLELYGSNCLTIGKQVAIHTEGSVRIGTAVGLDATGALRVQFGDLTETIQSGEASVRTDGSYV